MEKSLLIVESPTKAKTLQKYLGPEFIVRSTKGHIKDLPRNELGVDLEHDFQPKYVTILGKAKVIQELKKAASGIDEVYLGPDPDREGEAIAWHIAEALGDKNRKFHRILLMELTPKGIKEALSKPTALDRARYESQQARRILDRLVGYQISPLLWQKVKTGLSAGRVQSVALRLICDRERAIMAFVPEEYWSLIACLSGRQPPPLEARLVKIRGQEAKIADVEAMDRLLEELDEAVFKVARVDKKPQKRNPSPPFITSTLQIEASRRLRFPPRKTMLIAQRLYEGIDLGDEGPVGLITYMRTDSTRVSGEALEAVRRFINETYGPDYLPKAPHRYKSPKAAQEAHEAIRPTAVVRRPPDLKNFLEKDEYALYELIWRRFVASQMSPAIFQVTTVDVTAGDCLFRATASVLQFPGFTALYQEVRENEEEAPAKLPPLEVGEVLALRDLDPQQHFTKPPPRFTEASLIRELEVQGIGRPSTYATILSNLQDRIYVAKEKYGLRPTELGLVVNDLLVESFPGIMDLKFTAHLETDLDRIAEGQVPWQKVLREFHSPFSQALKAAKEKMPRVKQVPSGLVCPECGQPLVVRWGKNGEFLGCSAFPECKFTGNFTRDQQGKLMLMEKAPETEAVPCPQEGCTGSLVRRRSRRGFFYGCSRYPDCKYIQNKPPVKTSCPQCGFPWLAQKGKKLVCPREGCGYEEAAAANEAANS
ncbi:MAG: type I DNA topoisomerase [Deltaproteobacteria bacterium]|nr:type I DNA topoisomerase [Deltaproteobacteria bacterium]